jgi:hypothetical protein
MPAGVGGFLVDSGVDQLDEGLEQGLELDDERPVGEGNRRLRRERFGEPLVRGRERHDLAGDKVMAVDELQHADDLALVILHRHREERFRAVTRLLVEAAGAREVEALLGVGVGDVHRRAVDRGVCGDHRVVRLAVPVELDRKERDRVAGRAAERDVQRAGAYDLEVELARVLVTLDQVQRAAVGAGDGLGRDEDLLEQRVEVLLERQRRADLVQLVEPAEQIVRRSC